ncbi:unnamed protein product [Vicia faba]|uniref:Uncharacterized protein n=1 Tax=Vicia faba TaxID=3906 RepID=A0AAV0ZL75_VICFA|nr:unnamed protein product [Vicia faba]
MKGFGSYNDWSYYASPSSNLSAFATPFSVKRSSPVEVSPPFIDPGDAARPGFPYRYPDRYEPQQYFNSYGVHQDRDSVSVSVVPDHWSSFSGFTASDGVSRGDYANNMNELGFSDQNVAKQFADFGNGKENQIGVRANKANELGLGFAGQTVGNQFADFGNGKGNQIGVGRGFGLNQTNFTGSVADERMKSGCQDVTVSHVEGPHMIGWEKHSLTTSADPLDDKPFWWRTTKLPNAGCQDITDGHGEVPHMIGWEKHSLPTSGDCVDDKSCWWRPTKPMPVDFSHTSILHSLPLSLETHHEAPLKLAVDSGDHHFSYTGVYDKHLGQQDKQTRVDTVSSTSITGSCTDLNLGIFVPDGSSGPKKFNDINEAAACFGLNLCMNLDSNEASSSNNAMVSDMNDSGDVVDYKDKARHEFPYLQPNPDSPCWKGAPAAHFSYYESSQVFPPENVPKNECCGSVIREPQSFLLDGKNNVEKPCDSSFQLHIQIADQETYSVGSSLKQNSEARFASADCNVVNAGPFHSEPSCDYELQYQDDITKMKDNSVPPTKPIDYTGCNENICSASATSLTGGHALSLSSSVEDASTTSEKSAAKVSTEELNAQMLVDTMNKFSQLLLNHCLNDAFELEEQNCNILIDVITNLNTCVLKNAERINLAQECFLRQPETSRCAVESCELQQGVQLTKIAPEYSVDEPENQLAQKADLCFRSEKPHWMPSGFISLSGGAEMTKEENMTKAIKNILSENFDDDEATESQTLLYKNLWLEAEAALCSVSYKNRYNQMKIEMEKQSYKQRDMEQHSKSEVIPSLSRSESSAIEVNKCLNSDSSAATIPKELSQSKFSSDMNRLDSLTPEADGGQNLYNFIHNYAVSGINKEVAGNDEASVMARYNQTSWQLKKQIIKTRFHFLKSRAAEDSSSVSSTEKLFEFSGEGIKETVITKDALEGESLNANLKLYTAVDESTPKEIHLDWGDRTYEFQPPNYHFDGLATDWEHV